MRENHSKWKCITRNRSHRSDCSSEYAPSTDSLTVVIRNKVESHVFLRKIWLKIACKLAIKIETVSCRRVTYFLPPALERIKNTYCMDKRPFLYLYQSQIHYDTRKYNFTNRIISIWNGLPDTVISATTVDTSKARLDRFWQNQEVIYNWKTDIHIGSRS